MSEWSVIADKGFDEAGAGAGADAGAGAKAGAPATVAVAAAAAAANSSHANLYSPSSSSSSSATDFQHSDFLNDPLQPMYSPTYHETNTTDSNQNTSFFYVTEKYNYNFDFPSNQLQTGYVEISNSKIIIMFPELRESPLHFQKFAHTQSVQLIINRQVMFSYDWLPIYSVKDFWRVKDMLNKAFFEYSNKTQRNHFMAQKVMCNQTRQFNLLSTMCDTDKFYLTCIEDEYSSTISLDLKTSCLQPPSNRNLESTCVEIYIGNSLMFCTSRDLQTLDRPLQHFVTQFILHKLIKH